MVISKFDIFLICLDPTIGREIKKTRPCVIVSPDEMNPYLDTVIIAPLTSKMRRYPSRVACRFKRKQGEIVLDQIRTVDKARLIKKLGALAKPYRQGVSNLLVEMFSD